MGSRMMHYCISAVLMKQMKIEDSQFLLGGLAPDVYESSTGKKEHSHFTKKDSNGISYIDYRGFYEKYLTAGKPPFHLGYYCHLITDDIWLKDIYYKKIKWLPADQKVEAKQRYYRDFWRLNGRLRDHYAVELVPLQACRQDIGEIDSSLLELLIGELERDFAMADSVKDQELEVLDFPEVIATLEKTIAICGSKIDG